MIEPIAIATDGYISTSSLRTLTLATLGWLVIATTPVPTTSGGSGGSTYEYVHKDELTERRKKIIEDDEEILCIIKTFLKCQS